VLDRREHRNTLLTFIRESYKLVDDLVESNRKKLETADEVKELLIELFGARVSSRGLLS